jgi:hypothetical protein
VALTGEWWKSGFGTYPYSFDVMDILRGVIPQTLLGTFVGKSCRNNTMAAIVGASSAALSRGQTLTEILFYPEEFAALPENTAEHNVFLIFFNAVLAGLASFGLSSLLVK